MVNMYKIDYIFKLYQQSLNNLYDSVLNLFQNSILLFSRMQMVIDKLAKYLKQGGEILFRDYGRYDMVELRFKPGQCLTNHFYVRGDGTWVYFFTEGKKFILFL